MVVWVRHVAMAWIVDVCCWSQNFINFFISGRSYDFLGQGFDPRNRASKSMQQVGLREDSL